MILEGVAGNPEGRGRQGNRAILIPGWWAGTGARLLGMAGGVTERHMRLLVAEGKHPSTGQHLRRIWRRFPATTEESHRAALDRVLARLPADVTPEQRHQAWVKVMTAPERHAVAAFDVMVAPVKSVSLLWAFGDDTVKNTVMAAHHAGIRAVLLHLEKHAAFTRTGTDGIRQVDADGLAAMVFDHRMSRDHDPQLHSHIVISTKVRTTTDSTERWLALDGRALYQASIAARVAYERAVEGELERMLGVRFGVREGSDIREILGSSAASIRRFSKRRSSIEDEMSTAQAGPPIPGSGCRIGGGGAARRTPA
jgi:hypothetical protein